MTCRFGMTCLDADGLRQGIGHRAMSKRAKQSALAVHMEIARRPHCRSTDVAGEGCVFGCELIENLCDVLRMNRGSARFTHGEIVEPLARIPVVSETCIKIGAVGLAPDKRSQRIKRVLHISNHPQIDRSTAANLFPEPIQLNNFGVLRIELLIGEIRSQHQQGVAVHHGVVARRKTKQPGHSDVIRIVVFDKFLATQRMDDRRLEAFGHCNELGMSALAARTAKDSDLACAVENVSRSAKFIFRWNQD